MGMVFERLTDSPSGLPDGSRRCLGQLCQGSAQGLDHEAVCIGRDRE
jgi:hypothetical protein